MANELNDTAFRGRESSDLGRFSAELPDLGQGLGQTAQELLDAAIFSGYLVIDPADYSASPTAEAIDVSLFSGYLAPEGFDLTLFSGYLVPEDFDFAYSAREFDDPGLHYLTQDLVLLYRALQTIEQDTTVLLGSQLALENELTVLYSASGLLEYDLTTLYGSSLAIEQDTTALYTAFPAKIANTDPSYTDPVYIAEGGTPGPMLSPWEEAWKFNRGTLLADFHVTGSKINLAGALQGIGSMSLSEIPDEFTTNWGESAQTSWSMTITDKTGYFHPLNEASPWYGVMNEEGITGNPRVDLFIYGMNLTDVSRFVYDNVPLKTVNMATQWGGLGFHFQGIPHSYTSRRSAQNLVYVFNWKGYDQALTLFSEDQTMPTVRNRWSRDILQEICSAYSVPLNLSYLPDNFIIRLMHRQKGKPIDWIMQILSVSVAEWTVVDGVVFTPYLPQMGLTPGLDNSAHSSRVPPPRYIYDLNSTCVDEQVLENTASRVINDIVATMAIEAGNTGGSKVSVTDFKEYEVVFPEELSAVQWRILAGQGGFFTDFIFYDAQGQVTSVRNPRGSVTVGGVVIQGSSPVGGAYADWKYVNGGIVKAKKVKFTWGNIPGGNTATAGFGEILFYGTTLAGDAFGSDPFDVPGNHLDPFPGLRARSRNFESVRARGIQTVELAPNPLITDRRWLQLHADRYLIKLSRGNKASYKVPYNPDIMPGTVVLEINEELSYRFTRVITSANHVTSNSVEKRGSQYSGYAYRPFTLQHIGPVGQVLETLSV